MTTSQFVIKTDNDGIVYVRTRLCGSKYVDAKRGEEYLCDRPEGHLPSLWHRDRQGKAVWYKDRS